jgi:hypothetical protein
MESEELEKKVAEIKIKFPSSACVQQPLTRIFNFLAVWKTFFYY